MATILSVKDVLRFDERFLAETLVPFLARNGAAGHVLFELGGDKPWQQQLNLRTGLVVDGPADLTLRLPRATFEAVCQGKAKVDEACATVSLEGPAALVRIILRACRPAEKLASSSKDIAAEKKAAKKKKDLKKDEQGRPIKGVVLDAEGAPVGEAKEPVAQQTSVTGGQRSGADPASFAAQNLAQLLVALLALAGDPPDDKMMRVARGQQEPST
jgi:hypothetical protein